ncbi:hypothetical protein NDU88_004379 [Pleurodeles waltl]|uniref:Uncharacterized protein n=1 Tax=Pleurodeles waltl TaxID=8319 RepID=A0AAV7TRT3_PLEWA|nr:hypothetical protein NDU88_004379 [Pleurodeles waltl]
MVAARPSGTNHVEQTEPAGFPRECGCIRPSTSRQTRPPERAALPGARSQSRGTSASSPSPAPASPLRETGRSQRVGNPSAAPDAAASALEVPRHNGSSRRGPGSTDLGGRAQDRSRPHGTRNTAVRFKQSSAGNTVSWAIQPEDTAQAMCVAVARCVAVAERDRWYKEAKAKRLNGRCMPG